MFRQSKHRMRRRLQLYFTHLHPFIFDCNRLNSAIQLILLGFLRFLLLKKDKVEIVEVRVYLCWAILRKKNRVKINR